jgi:hypothetical protein
MGKGLGIFGGGVGVLSKLLGNKKLERFGEKPEGLAPSVYDCV